MDYSPSGSSVHGILQARILEWVVIPSSRGSFQPGMEPASLTSPALAGRFFTTKIIKTHKQANCGLFKEIWVSHFYGCLFCLVGLRFSNNLLDFHNSQYVWSNQIPPSPWTPYSTNTVRIQWAIDLSDFIYLSNILFPSHHFNIILYAV